MRDVLRPVILRGWRALDTIDILSPALSLDDLFLAVMVGSRLLSLRLRPELKGTESLHVMDEVADAVDSGALSDPSQLLPLYQLGSEQPPKALLQGIVSTITDRYYGLQSLALASLRERRNLESKVTELPDLAGTASTDEEKLALARLWLSQWATYNAGIWFRGMDDSWVQTTRGVRPHSGNFAAVSGRIADKAAKKVYEKEWVPRLLELFCEFRAPKKYRILAKHLALDTDANWGYCQTCRTTQRLFPGSCVCINCRRDRVVPIDPEHRRCFRRPEGLLPRKLGPGARATHQNGQWPSLPLSTRRSSMLLSPTKCSPKPRSMSCSSRTSIWRCPRRVHRDAPPSMSSPARQQWKSVSTSARCPVWPCAICRHRGPATNNDRVEPVAAATPLRRSWLLAAPTATTSTISLSPTP